MDINKDKLLDNFKNFKNIANVGILSCFKNLFCINGIIKNMAFYIMMIIIIFHFIAIFVFVCKQSKKLKKITIKSTKLTKKTIGSKAFTGINKKAVIKCPKGKKAAYKKILLKKGMKKSMKFK